jgi:hypothetical protein
MIVNYNNETFIVQATGGFFKKNSPQSSYNMVEAPNRGSGRNILGSFGAVKAPH